MRLLETHLYFGPCPTDQKAQGYVAVSPQQPVPWADFLCARKSGRNPEKNKGSAKCFNTFERLPDGVGPEFQEFRDDRQCAFRQGDEEGEIGDRLERKARRVRQGHAYGERRRKADRRLFRGFATQAKGLYRSFYGVHQGKDLQTPQ